MPMFDDAPIRRHCHAVVRGVSHMPAAMVTRARALLQQPDLVDQAQIGICGAASLLHVMLYSKPARFIDLLRSYYTGIPFNGINCGFGWGTKWETIKSKWFSGGRAHSILAGRRSWQFRHATVRHQLPVTELDFLIGRSLGKLLKMVDARLYAAQKTFTYELFRDANQLPALRNRQACTRSRREAEARELLDIGHLALNTAGMTAAITRVCPFQICSHVTNDNNDAIVAAVNNHYGAACGHARPFVIAAVNLRSDAGNDHIWCNDTVAAVPGGDPCTLNGPDQFVHWIVIPDRITALGGGGFSVPTWTWGQPVFNATLPSTEGYIHSVFNCFIP